MNRNLFNFYKRYKWTAQNFTDFQEAVMDMSRSAEGGSFQGAVVKGLEIEPGTGLSLNHGGGMAMSASGYLSVMDSGDSVDIDAPASDLRRSLIVIRPKLNLNNEITKPTSPFEQVFLNVNQDAEIIVIDGTDSANPEYPTKESEDVILCGVRLSVGQTTIGDNDLDFSIREIIGKNGHMHQRVINGDMRLMPYRDSAKVLGISPAQLVGEGPRSFAFARKGTLSIYPTDSNGDCSELPALLNFETGEVSGGDEQSNDFTPVIPSGNNSLIAAVFITNQDTVDVVFGGEYSRDDCFNAVRSQWEDVVPYTPFGNVIAYVILNSVSGSLADIDVIDVRGSTHPGQMKATILNNQSSAIDLPNMPQFNTVGITGFKFLFHIIRTAGANRFSEMGHCFVHFDYNASTWQASKMSVGEDSGVEFEVAVGTGSNNYKLQYTSDNKAGGGYSGIIRIAEVQMMNVV